MITHFTKKQFDAAIIAQDDDNDYSESGWVALVHDGQAALARYGHCSCYDTFSALCGGGISDYFEEGDPAFDWTGTPDELVRLAARRGDPRWPDRDANPSDYDHEHLVAVYDAIITWDREGRP